MRYSEAHTREGQRTRVFGVLLAMLVPLVTAALLEILVRLLVDDGHQFDLEMWKYARDVKQVAADVRIGHEHRPDVQTHLMGVDVAINSRKLRDREIPFRRAPNTLRILMLGDSLVFGWGVPIDATIPKRLEALINASGVRAEVINAGVGNYNTRMEVSYYVAEGRLYRPDLVIVGYFINDAERTPQYDHGWIAYHSAAYTYINARFDVLLRMIGVSSHEDWLAHLKRIYDPADPISGWSETAAAFRQLSETARSDGTAVAVLNLPELRRLRPYPFRLEEEKVHGLVNALGLPYVDLLPAVAERDPPTLWVTPDDPHPNAIANDLYAQSLFKYLQSQNLLSVRQPERGSALTSPQPGLTR